MSATAFIRRSSTVAITTGLLAAGGATAAFADTTPNPTATVPVTASVGQTIGFESLPAPVAFGTLTPGQTSVQQMPIAVSTNDPSGIQLSVSSATGGSPIGNLTNSATSQLNRMSGGAELIYPGQPSGVSTTAPPVWVTFAGDTNDGLGVGQQGQLQGGAAGPTAGSATQYTGGTLNGGIPLADGPITSANGVATMPAEVAIRVPVNQAPDAYTDTLTITLAAS